MLFHDCFAGFRRHGVVEIRKPNPRDPQSGAKQRLGARTPPPVSQRITHLALRHFALTSRVSYPVESLPTPCIANTAGWWIERTIHKFKIPSISPAVRMRQYYRVMEVPTPKDLFQSRHPHGH